MRSWLRLSGRVVVLAADRRRLQARERSRRRRERNRAGLVVLQICVDRLVLYDALRAWRFIGDYAEDDAGTLAAGVELFLTYAQARDAADL